MYEESSVTEYDGTDEELIDGWPEDEPEAPDLLGPCPPWCAGRPHLDNTSEYPCDQAHESERLEFEVGTAEGRTELEGSAQIVWVPFSELPWGSLPYVAMHWDDRGRNLSPDDVLAVADAIEAWAVKLRGLAEQLRGIRGGKLPDQGLPLSEG